ncbi:hypothetical protein DSO57_1022741 [Entomophthora muscae]|uniref:Uncharacterized protein n=1 Tax=Entomophthora muscae TaxID=34485 RepID=A0ACC2RU31_9FUNG|nr:hypothetical protein DSO57_1022741 [Entomophthora muscae]
MELDTMNKSRSHIHSPKKDVHTRPSSSSHSEQELIPPENLDFIDVEEERIALNQTSVSVSSTLTSPRTRPRSPSEDTLS